MTILKNILTATALLLSNTAWALAAHDRQENCIDVAVFSINDFHGALVANPAKGLPGAPALVQTLDSLKSVYPYHLTVTAGDNFGGSFFYKATLPHTLMPQFFKDMGIEISAIGNHEWDDGQAAMAKKWSDAERYPENWKFTYVCANVREADGKLPSYVSPCAVDSVVLPHGKAIKIGFVGLLTSNTPFQASQRNLKGLSFDGDYPGVLDSLKQTEAFRPVADADIRILLTHIGTQNDEQGHPIWEDRDMPNLYQINDPSYHAIISGHSHQLVCGHINDAHYPIVQGKSHGMYICCLKFSIDTVSRKVVDVQPSTHLVTPKNRRNAKVLRLQTQIDEQLATTLTPGGVPIGKQLTYAKNDIPHDRDRKHRQAYIGKIVCTAYAESARKSAHLSQQDKVVGVSHIGGIRTGFVKGPISVLDVGEVLPFSNPIRLYKITGKQLTELVDFGLHNQKFGHLQMGNLSFTLNRKGKVKSLAYVNGKEGHQKIKAKDSCYLAADDFMTHGGDGYPTHLFPEEQEIKGLELQKTTDALVSYLKTLPYLEKP